MKSDSLIKLSKMMLMGFEYGLNGENKEDGIDKLKKEIPDYEKVVKEARDEAEKLRGILNDE